VRIKELQSQKARIVAQMAPAQASRVSSPFEDTESIPSHFIRRTPKFKAHDEESEVVSYKDVSVTLPRTFDGKFEVKIVKEYHF
jgi:hypothetical protein